MYRKAEVATFGQSVLLLMLLLPHLFITICHGRPASSHRNSDVVSSRQVRSDGDGDDGEPSVYAVVERDDHVSGKANDYFRLWQ